MEKTGKEPVSCARGTFEVPRLEPASIGGLGGLGFRGFRV